MLASPLNCGRHSRNAVADGAQSELDLIPLLFLVKGSGIDRGGTPTHCWRDSVVSCGLPCGFSIDGGTEDGCDSIAFATDKRLSGTEPCVIRVVFDAGPVNCRLILLQDAGERGATAVQTSIDTAWWQSSMASNIGNMNEVGANVLPTMLAQ